MCHDPLFLIVQLALHLTHHERWGAMCSLHPWQISHSVAPRICFPVAWDFGIALVRAQRVQRDKLQSPPDDNPKAKGSLGAQGAKYILSAAYEKVKHVRCVYYPSVEGGKHLAIYLCHEASCRAAMAGDFCLNGLVDGDNRQNPHVAGG
jgi:hypothetical protein